MRCKSIKLPTALLQSVFAVPSYSLSEDLWAEQSDDLATAWYSLSSLEQALLQYYYAHQCSYAQLGDTFSLPVRTCRLAVQKGRFVLRMAANPLYRDAVREVNGLNTPKVQSKFTKKVF